MPVGTVYYVDVVNFQVDKIFEDLPTGMYTIYLDNGSCLHEYELDLFKGIELIADQNILTIECGQTETELNIALGQSQGTILYEWSTGDNSENININQSGYFSLSIYDDCNTLFFEWDIDLASPDLGEIDEFSNIIFSEQ